MRGATMMASNSLYQFSCFILIHRLPASRRDAVAEPEPSHESSSRSENETDTGQNEQRIDDDPKLPVRKPRGLAGGSCQYGFAGRNASFNRRMDVNQRPEVPCATGTSLEFERA